MVNANPHALSVKWQMFLFRCRSMRTKVEGGHSSSAICRSSLSLFRSTIPAAGTSSHAVSSRTGNSASVRHNKGTIGNRTAEQNILDIVFIMFTSVLLLVVSFGHIVLEAVDRKSLPDALVVDTCCREVLRPQLTIIILMMNVRTLDEMAEFYHCVGNLLQ